jgi:hypothetical protein
MTLPEKPEPSVLDYIKGKIFPGKNPVIEIPGAEPAEVKKSIAREKAAPKEKPARRVNRFFWLLILVLIMLLLGQKLLEPPFSSITVALVFWGCAIALVVMNWFKGRFVVDLYSYDDEEPGDQAFRPVFLYISLGVGLIATLLFTENRFNNINLTLWIISIISLLAAFFPRFQWREWPQSVSRTVRNFFETGFPFHLSPWTLVCLATFALVTFFRFFRLDQIPNEMISDHAEKLLDVYDVLNGAFSIFFVRNTGREAFQLYLSAGVAMIFGTGISFLTLKIGTALMGLFTAVYMYFLGKEVGNQRVGLFAFLICGIGYWPNVISRIGLRFTLYSAFTAPALYYFFRGLRRKRWSDLVLSGIFIGIGLQGYSPYRVVPVLIIIGVLLYLAHYWKTAKSKFAVIGLVVVGVSALILFLPLLRYIMDQPDAFAYRALTRAGSLERPLPGPAWQIFLSNLWWASIMPFWKDGTIWVHSVPYRPALDAVSGAMFLLGLVVCILRYIRQKDWRIPFLIFAVPFLMLPSIISLAFPDENPCLNRTAGALVPIFLIAGMGLDTILQNIKKQFNGLNASIVTTLIFEMVMFTSVLQNYNLVFHEYDEIYTQSSLNTSEIGEVIHNFVEVYGDVDSAYVVGYPYWVDTRLVGINSGNPIKDYAIWPDTFQLTVTNKRAKLFILNNKDTESLDKLRRLYPDYYETVYQSRVPSKNFIMFLVPPSVNSSEEVGIPVP